mgnify:CR=1 FL=1
MIKPRMARILMSENLQTFSTDHKSVHEFSEPFATRATHQNSASPKDRTPMKLKLQMTTSQSVIQTATFTRAAPGQ